MRAVRQRGSEACPARAGSSASVDGCSGAHDHLPHTGKEQAGGCHGAAPSAADEAGLTT